MKFNYNILLLIFVGLVSGKLNAQNIEVTHQSNGTVLSVPVQSIDSVIFQLTPPPSMKNIYQNNGNILGIAMDDVDSITYIIPNPALLPQVSTGSPNVLSSSSAFIDGHVINDGGSPVIQRGFCWSLSPNPTIANNTSQNGSGLGSFNHTVQPLLPLTTYYVRAYAINSEGTAYGNQVTLTTSAANSNGSLPVVQTELITYNGGLTALSGGNIIDDGGLVVTSRGVCLAVGVTPTINNITTNDGTGAGVFQSVLNSLLPNTTYFVRAYATNDAGTGYGVTYSFTTDSGQGAISSLNCSGALFNGILVTGVPANNVSAEISYTGGNGGPHNGQTVISTGISGLTATLSAGTFANGAGNLTYTITGTPNSGGTTYFEIEIGGASCILQIEVELGSIASLDCAGAIINGTLFYNANVSGFTVEIPYTGGNGGLYYGQTVNSSGLIVELPAGNFANGVGTLTYEITGAPMVYGDPVMPTFTFEIHIGGQFCSVSINIDCWSNQNTTAVNDVINPATGKTWMDRNLGTGQVATSSTDHAAYGDLYQWGRGADGHQCILSHNTSNQSSTDQPGHGDFILVSNAYDWRSPQNSDLWQGVNGVNNPCPDGYRLPTYIEFYAEMASWSSNDIAGAFASPLKLTASGARNGSSVYDLNSIGRYWTSSINWDISYIFENSWHLYVGSNGAFMAENVRYSGLSVRCIKD